MAEPIRKDLIYATISRARALIDEHTNLTERHELREQIIRDDESLTADEKTEAMRILSEAFERCKVRNKTGTRRQCDDCLRGCFATSYCEHCIRNYLKNNFSNWTSGNDDIDDLIQRCQMKSL